MSIRLTKGQKISLSKESPGLSEVILGLGWDPNKYVGKFDFDLDASCFLCGDNGRVTSDADFIFYSNPDHPSGAVHHTGDDKTGGNSEDGDDEQIIIDLSKVPANITKIACTATIYDAVNRDQNFGQVSNAYVRLVNSKTNADVVRYELGEEFSIETAIVVCEIYRYNGEWKFNAVGSGFSGGLAALCKNFGIDAESE